MFVGICYVQRTVLAGPCSPLWGGRGERDTGHRAPPKQTAKGPERDLHQPVLPEMGSSRMKGSACPHDLSVLSIYRT